MTDYFEDIIKNKNQTIGAKVVFFDIVSYSKRRTQSQAMVINSMIECLDIARAETAKKYLHYSEKNSISFRDDVLFLPAGDGAAVCFPFEGLHDVHLFFAKELIKEVVTRRENNKCEKYEENGWCNCHANFALSIGVAEGKCVLYRDLNNRYNIAGNAINLAARVMGQADADQILFSDDAYWQLIDLVEDPHMDENFKRFSEVRIKHGEKISIYQYVGNETFLNSEEPEKLELSRRSRNMTKQMEMLGFPAMPDAEKMDFAKLKSFMVDFETLLNTFGKMAIDEQANSKDDQ
ncbi:MULTISPECIES: adenylate/guanylate cyclase domain-containing protein [unclassified Roseovarius]|uniref:adenylate/guanylate cyclase domain-containing protein n=1 Tax=unclassified Roseovarius TaxID=2614913 RepID=UPI00273D3407|nr:adenylate/guanylate cyclase domain-containing protein [Roseovarius sp. MMSF_3350]